MSKKVIKDEFVPSEKLKQFGLNVYETVERGEKPKVLNKVGEMEYTPGEIESTVTSFDEDIELGRAVIVQDRHIQTEKPALKAFKEEKPINAKEEQPLLEIEEEAEPEPEPAITEEELEAIRTEAHQKGFDEGIAQGKKAGQAESEKKYQAEKKDYLDGLAKGYADAIAQLDVFRNAVTELDEALPNILINMVTDIVGEERKINDDVVASVAKKSLAHLRELEKVTFLVHPDDVQSMQDSFPDYDTLPDNNVAKGSLKVSTNIGEMNFSIERMLKEFVERIHEEFSPTEEG